MQWCVHMAERAKRDVIKHLKLVIYIITSSSFIERQFSGLQAYAAVVVLGAVCFL